MPIHLPLMSDQSDDMSDQVLAWPDMILCMSQAVMDTGRAGDLLTPSSISVYSIRMLVLRGLVQSASYTLLAGAVAITLEQKQHKERESEMKGDKRTLKIEIKEMELAHEEMVKNLKKVITTYSSITNFNIICYRKMMSLLPKCVKSLREIQLVSNEKHPK